VSADAPTGAPPTGAATPDKAAGIVTLPTHVGIILDGNRRWAKARGLKSIDGHREGAETFKKVSLAAFERGVKYLSAYVFSSENWQRTTDEVSFLMKLLVRAVELHLDEFHKNNIKIVILGERDGLSKTVLNSLQRTESKTSGNTGGTLALCFNYGGKAELVHAVKQIMATGMSLGEVNQQIIDAYVYQPQIPGIDLLIRTSGEKRLSGFMLWRSDYAELCFVDKMWPDYTVQDLDEALADYANRSRRFGQ
jgi:undecaprenyl diphosphate synthase